MSAEDFPGVLEEDDHRFELPAVWPKGEWFSVARDRVGDHAVTRIQRSNAKNFFAMTGVYVRTGSGWTPEFENGDLWGRSPAEGRPAVGRPFQMLTGVSGVAVGAARQPVAFLAGMVTTSVHGLRVSSVVEEHYVEIAPRRASSSCSRYKGKRLSSLSPRSTPTVERSTRLSIRLVRLNRCGGVALPAALR